jgi:geranylgeranyl diphosphate synthase type II
VPVSSRKFTAEFNRWLDLFLEQQLAADSYSSSYVDLSNKVKTMLLRGGKRLRPQLALLAYHAYGGTELESFMPIAASIELLHCFLLMHDDTIDRDDVRWGALNIRGLYKNELTLSDVDAVEHYADAYNILAGDMCYSLSVSALLQADFPPAILVRLTALLQASVRAVIAGELDDVQFSMPSTQPTKTQILAMYQAKTARYSFSLPLQAGALAAGAPKHEFRKLLALAENAGVAFQIQDDLLNAFGTTAKTGKPTMSDIREGKQTLLLHLALQKMNTPQRHTFNQYFANQNISEQQAATIRTIFQDCGAQQATEQFAKSYLTRALKQVQTLKITSAAQQHLQRLLKQLSQRNT